MELIGQGEVFHVHTFRCRHAGEEKDEEYIKKAIELGASGIAFTDHAPFPSDVFRNRMLMAELPEYVKTLNTLKKKFRTLIKVWVGLEIEFIPSFDHMENGISYYKQLKSMEGLDFLMLGQHMYEIEAGVYSFSLDKEEVKKLEPSGLGKAMITGIATGYFDVVAHPDRCFRRRKVWDEELADISKAMIEHAIKYDVILEQNESSKKNKHHYWKEFWELAETVSDMSDNKSLRIIRGLDAHNTGEISMLTPKYSLEDTEEFNEWLKQYEKEEEQDREFVARLNSVEDGYDGFNAAVLTYVKKNRNRFDRVYNYMKKNPQALSSDIVEFISNQDDFYDDAVYPKK